MTCRAWRTSAAALAGLVLAAAGALAAELPASTLLSGEEAVPWRGVGRVNVAEPRRLGSCTGALVAPDLVLTAAHCVVHPGTGRPFAPGNVHFVAGWYRGKGTGHSRAAAVAVHPDWPGVGARNPIALSTDLALIRLAEPLDAEVALPFATARPPLPGDPVTLISYRRDRAHALTRQDDCRYAAVVERVLVLDCAVVPGASGAPVFAWADGAPRLVAVLSAGSRDGPPRAFAARADTAVALLRAHLP